jgi:TolA-binding protein
MIETHQRVGADPLVRATRLEMAPRFAPGSAWFQAQQADSVREAGSRFARSSYKAVALEYHLAARQKGSREDWRAALGLYEAILERWPKDAEAPELRLNAGEAGAQLGEYALALRHYREAATAGSDSVAERALWQRTAVSDAWYESSRSELNGKRSGLGRDSLAHLVVENADELIARFPEHQDNADLTWRQGNIAFAHGWFERSATDFERLATRWPADKRAPRATILRADAFFKLQRFDAAGAAYEQALAAAQRAGSDSLARRASEAIPVSYYKHAEAFAAADPGAHAKHAELFEQVATRWPGYEHAPTAQYRAGLAWLEAKDRAQGVRAMEALLQKFPKSEYLRDAHLEIAKAWESGDEKEKSAAAYARFAESFPKDSSAADAWLKSADLYASAGLSQKADAIRLDYVKRYPNDHENAMQILEVFARRDLERVDAAHPISAMLPPPPAPVAKAKKGVKAKPVVAPPAAPASLLAQYLKRAEAHPELASKDLLAQTAFLQGEEANERFAALKLTLPLAKSIGEKQKRLDAALVHYRRSIDHGISRWAHASSYRIGEALVGFGTALEHSERPADLQGDDLLAYEDVLLQRGAVFFDRGEQVWSDLLRQKKDEASRDEWVGKAQSALWQRIGSRFFFRPEMEFPLIAGSQPSRPRASDERTSKGTATARGDSSSPRASLRAEDAPR